jgi:hypothetical protein
MKARPSLPLVVIIVGLLASALTPLPARARQGGRAMPTAGDLYYALVIGNDDYESLPKLGTAAADAREVERVLREYYGFQTTLLVNARRAEIVAALSDYGRRLGAGASLLVYYAGHGYRDAVADKAYWLPVDATREDASKRVAADELTSAVRAVQARHVLVVSDSCYSGGMPIGVGAPPSRPEERERFLQKMAAGRSRTLLASGGDEPLAGEGVGGHSVFADALLRGLRRMEGPRFTASELFVGYVLSPVAGRSGRIPVYNPLRDSGHESGDFVFTRIKPAPAPGSCDDEELKTGLYKIFLDNYKGGPGQQKAAYEAGKEFIAKYGDCPDEDVRRIISYVRNWVGKYEEAVRLWEQMKSRKP